MQKHTKNVKMPKNVKMSTCQKTTEKTDSNAKLPKIPPNMPKTCPKTRCQTCQQYLVDVGSWPKLAAFAAQGESANNTCNTWWISELAQTPTILCEFRLLSSAQPKVPPTPDSQVYFHPMACVHHPRLVRNTVGWVNTESTLANHGDVNS